MRYGGSLDAATQMTTSRAAVVYLGLILFQCRAGGIPQDKSQRAPGDYSGNPPLSLNCHLNIFYTASSVLLKQHILHLKDISNFEIPFIPCSSSLKAAGSVVC